MKKSNLFALLFSAFVVALATAQDSTTMRKLVPGLSDPKLVEFSPTISADGKTIIFESSVDEEKGWELFESQLENGVWSKPVPIKAINEKCQFIAGPSISYDGNELYYTAFIDKVTQTEDIFYSVRTGDNTWSEPKSIGAPINTDENYEGFPSISSDGKSLYFIRLNLERGEDKKSKEPCFIIYVSKKAPDGTWGEPTPLPAPINTGCERDPKIMADNRTLIFSSIRQGGLGKYDMYQTALQNDGSWSTPITLDFINSTDNDQSPCIDASGNVMFFYSNKDIYAVGIPPKYRQFVNTVVTGRVLEDKSLKAASANIIVTNTKTKDSFTLQNNESDGEYSIVLSAGNSYQVIFDNPTLFPDTMLFNLVDQKTFQLERKNVLLRTVSNSKIDIIDKDLKFKLNVWLSVTQGETRLVADSVAVDKVPLPFTFSAPLDYLVTATKNGYNSAKEEWKFKTRRAAADRNVLLQLEHEKTEFVASVVNSVSKQKVKIKVYANNKGVEETLIAEAGEKMLLRKGDRYQVVTASEEGYFFSSKEIVAGEVNSITLEVVPIELDGKIALNNITFETNSAALKKSSQFELDLVVELMKVNPKLQVEISAHTDDVGEEDSNLKLSNKRATSALEYLVRKGVPKERMVPRGYGESKPLLENNSEENRAQNRRVELRVLKNS
ncbi:MAG TPA: OmpA family protein [Cyclobacteriaceae bacterium]|nr:OmpA family protein [Cyclobacteriaceae bacterium]